MIYTYQKPLRGKTVGVVFGTFAPLHQGHLDVIMRAKKECDGGCIVIVDGREGDRGGELMPLKKRYRYVREFFADDELVAVYPIDETEKNIPAYPNGWLPFLEVVKDIVRQGTKENPQPVFYVSEQAYYDRLTKEGFEAVLLDRTLNPISATMIRENPIKYWDKITFPFRRVFSTNILICGTASEGKTTLVKDLGKYFNAPYSHEYAREQYEKMDIEIIDEYDDLFWNVVLPKGWDIRATDHTMWNELLDNKGRKRATFFYKAAFYDRDAFTNFETRYTITTDHVADYDKDGYEVWRKSDHIGLVKDGEEVIYKTACVPAAGDYEKDDKIKNKLYEELENYMKENYPDYENIQAY